MRRVWFLFLCSRFVCDRDAGSLGIADNPCFWC
jgi:hypothetical protein